MNDNYTKEDCKEVITKMNNKWKDDIKMKEYITIETLFRVSKFEKYLNQDEALEENISSGVFVDNYSPISEATRKDYEEVYGE